MEEHYRRFGGRVAFLAVCIGIKRSMADYVRENGVTLPVAFDEGERPPRPSAPGCPPSCSLTAKEG